MTENQRSNSKGSSIWKTIDDVNATFDSLSIMNGGKIQIKSQKSNSEGNNIDFCEHCHISNCIHQFEQHELNSNMFIQEKDCINTEFLSFKNGSSENRSLEDIDVSLQAELEQLFPGGFSNENIENHWRLRKKGKNGERVNITAAGGDEDKLTNFDDFIKFKTNNNEIFFKFEDEVRACSPPFTTLVDSGDSSRSSSSCLLTGVHDLMKSEDLERSAHLMPRSNLSGQSNDSVNSVNNCTKGICASTSSNISISAGNASNEEGNKQDDLLPSNLGKDQREPKRCRNALLNGLIKRGLINNQEVNKFITLKKPEDFLTQLPNSYGNVASKRISANCYIDSDEFIYCKEDFPAL